MLLIPDVCLDFLIGGLCLSSRVIQLIQVDLYGVIRLLLGQKNYRLDLFFIVQTDTHVFLDDRQLKFDGF